MQNIGNKICRIELKIFLIFNVKHLVLVLKSFMMYQTIKCKNTSGCIGEKLSFKPQNSAFKVIHYNDFNVFSTTQGATNRSNSFVTISNTV